MRYKTLFAGLFFALIIFTSLTPVVAAEVITITDTPFSDSQTLNADDDPSTWEEYIVYKIYLHAGDEINIVLEVPDNCDFDLLLQNSYDPSQTIREDNPNVVAKSVTWTTGGEESITYEADDSRNYYILVLAAEGNGTYTITVNVNPVTGLNLVTIGMIGGIVAVVVVIIIFFILKKRRKAPVTPYPSYQPTYPTATKFCPYCGAQVPAEAAVCPSCGSPLD